MEFKYRLGDEVIAACGKGIILGINKEYSLATGIPHYLVKLNNPEFRKIFGVQANIRESAIKLHYRAPQEYFCPECEDEHFFYDGDYICCMCREYFEEDMWKAS